MSPDSEGLGAAVVAGVGSNLTQPSGILYFSIYIYIYIFYFSQNILFDISCKLSPSENISRLLNLLPCMQSIDICHGENNNNSSSVIADNAQS